MQLIVGGIIFASERLPIQIIETFCVIIYDSRPQSLPFHYGTFQQVANDSHTQLPIHPKPTAEYGAGCR